MTGAGPETEGADDVGGYVTAVRARLDDLAPEEVDELTGGLEADLAEALAGFDETPRQRFGDPAAYADELRTSAGLPPRREPDAVTGALDSARRSLDENLDKLRELSWFRPTRDFLVVLRPAWWVLRAWALLALLRLFAGGWDGIIGGPVWFLLLVGAVVLSVRIGLRTPFERPGARVALLVANGLAVLTVPFLLAAFPASNDQVWGEPYPGESSGLWMDGEPVRNVIPYDSQGRPLHDVTLYDDQGRPLQIGPGERWYIDQYSGQTSLPPQRWNVFPLDVPAPAEPSAGMTEDATGEPTGEPTEEPTPGPTTSEAPTPSATPPVTDEPTGAPSGEPSATIGP